MADLAHEPMNKIPSTIQISDPETIAMVEEERRRDGDLAYTYTLRRLVREGVDRRRKLRGEPTGAPLPFDQNKTT